MDFLSGLIQTGAGILNSANDTRKKALETVRSWLDRPDDGGLKDPGPSFIGPRQSPSPEVIPEPDTPIQKVPATIEFALPLEKQAIVNTIRDAEGTYKGGDPDGYATWFGGRVEPGLLKMTINDVVKRQKEEMAKGSSPSVPGSKKGSYAVGGGQFLYPEMSAGWAGLDPSKDLFTPDNQNKMIIEYLKREGQLSDKDLKDWTDKLQTRAGRTFASIKTPERNYGQHPKDYATMRKKFEYHLEKERARRAKLALK